MHPRIAIAAAAAAALLASGCAAEDADDPDDGSSHGALGFELHEAAVEPPGWTNYGTGLEDLVPLGDCVLGLGLYDNGYHSVGATWAGREDCTALRLDPEPDENEPEPEGAQGWRGAPFGSARDVIDYGDGVMVGLVGESLQRRGSDGEVTTLAEFDLPASAPPGEGGDRAGLCGLAATANGYLVSGFINEDHLLWSVADDGTVTGPSPAEDLFCNMEVDGDTVVALAGDGERLAWRSSDGGATWESAPIEGLPGSAWIIDLRTVDGSWRAIGATAPDDGPLALVQLDSADGLDWTVSGLQEVGEGRAGDVAFDADGSPIVIGDRFTRDGDVQQACNFVVTASGQWPELDWERGELGCAPDPVQAVATLADGRVVIASNRNLWIRPA